MKRALFVYCLFTSRHNDNRWFTVHAARLLKTYSRHKDAFKGVDVSLLTDSFSLGQLLEVCRQEELDPFGTDGFDVQIALDGLKDSMCKTYFMFYRFKQLARKDYDVVWTKDLDHDLSENDVRWLECFEGSECAYCHVPNCPLIQNVAAGDFGVKTALAGDALGGKFADAVEDLTVKHSQSMQYAFDIKALNMYLKRIYGDDFAEKGALSLIVDDWRLKNFERYGVDISRLNCMHVHYEKSFYETLKFEDPAAGTYRLDDKTVAMKPDPDYRFRFMRERNIIPSDKLLDIWMSYFT